MDANHDTRDRSPQESSLPSTHVRLSQSPVHTLNCVSKLAESHVSAMSCWPVPVTLYHNPAEFVARFLGLKSSSEVRKLLQVEELDDGTYLPKFNFKITRNVKFSKPPKSILDTELSQRPIYGLSTNSSNNSWSYRSKGAANVAGLIHVLMNFELCYPRPHWTYRLSRMEQHHECLLLFRLRRDTFAIATAVGAVFEDEDGVFQFRQINDKNCNILDPIPSGEWYL